MIASRYEQAYQYAARALQQDLLPVFLYHNAHHTLNEVVPVCEQLAGLEGVGSKERRLLRTAACFHDLGMTTVRSLEPEALRTVRAMHEERSAEMARPILAGLGFQEKEIEWVCRLILATRSGYSPQNLLEQIIRDADMSSIGGDLDYYRRTSEALRQELAMFGMPFSELEWLERQVKTLSSYTFQTAAARQLFDANRLNNIKANQARIAMMLANPR